MKARTYMKRLQFISWLMTLAVGVVLLLTFIGALVYMMLMNPSNNNGMIMLTGCIILTSMSIGMLLPDENKNKINKSVDN